MSNLEKAKKEIVSILKKYHVELCSRPLDNFIDGYNDDVDTYCYLYDEETEEEIDLFY